jgi:hypothetical protein
MTPTSERVNSIALRVLNVKTSHLKTLNLETLNLETTKDMSKNRKVRCWR